MTTKTLDELVVDLSSSDDVLRNQSLAMLTSYGSRATATLVPLLDSDDAALRAQATRALAHIADPSTADRLALLLDDDDAHVRAHAAWGLFRLNDPRALEALIKTIDDLPHPTNVNMSVATDGLLQIGEPALPKLADLLTAPNAETRARARLVIVTVASRLPPAVGNAWRARVVAADQATAGQP